MRFRVQFLAKPDNQQVPNDSRECFRFERVLDLLRRIRSLQAGTNGRVCKNNQIPLQVWPSGFNDVAAFELFLVEFVSLRVPIILGFHVASRYLTRAAIKRQLETCTPQPLAVKTIYRREVHRPNLLSQRSLLLRGERVWLDPSDSFATCAAVDPERRIYQDVWLIVRWITQAGSANAKSGAAAQYAPSTRFSVLLETIPTNSPAWFTMGPPLVPPMILLLVS